MKLAIMLSGVALFAVWLVWSGWSIFRLAVGLRTAAYRSSKWWAHAFSITIFVDFVLWTWGISRGGLNISDMCRSEYHQYYDENYWNSHSEEFGNIFPLHNKCNAHFDMVPAWMNSTIVILTVLALICLGVAVYLSVRSHPRRRNRSRA